MTKKLIIDWNEYNRSIDELAVQISESGFKPSFIICIARGGLRVGDILSRIFKVKCGYLGVESYSSTGEGKVSDVQNELTFARDLSTTSKSSSLIPAFSIECPFAIIKNVAAGCFTRYLCKFKSVSR